MSLNERSGDVCFCFLYPPHEGSEAVFTQLVHLVGRTVLAPFLSQTSVNGWVLKPFFLRRAEKNTFSFLGIICVFVVCLCCDATPCWARNPERKPRSLRFSALLLFFLVQKKKNPITDSPRAGHINRIHNAEGKNWEKKTLWAPN